MGSSTAAPLAQGYYVQQPDKTWTCHFHFTEAARSRRESQKKLVLLRCTFRLHPHYYVLVLKRIPLATSTPDLQTTMEFEHIKPRTFEMLLSPFSFENSRTALWYGWATIETIVIDVTVPRTRSVIGSRPYKDGRRVSTSVGEYVFSGVWVWMGILTYGVKTLV